MGKIRVKILSVAVLAFMILSQCSCAKFARIDDYRSRPFRCEIEFSVGDRNVCARIYAKGNEEIRMEILSPPSVEGLIIFRGENNEYAEYGGMILDADAFAEIFSYGAALAPEGDIINKSRVKGIGSVICLTVGKNENTGDYYEIYVNKKSGIPQEIRFGGKSILVRNFEFLE